MDKVAKPVSPRGQATIDKILDSSLEFIQREGISRLTTNHIAKEAGVKVGSIYHFFPNKEAILLELVRRWQQQIQAGLRAYLDQIDEDTSLAKLTLDVVLNNLNEKYEHSAAFDQIAAIGSLEQGLGELFNAHLEEVASMNADHYMRNPNRPKGAKKKLVVEFSLFLHPIVAEGMSLVAKKTGRAQERHLRWLTVLIESTIEAFEDSLR